AAGKPTSISFTPSCTSRSNMRCLRAESIGLTSAWLPSRRSVEHQIGARSSTVFGQLRSGKSTTSYGRYFQNGMDIGFDPPKGRSAPSGAGAAARVCRKTLPLAGKEQKARADQRCHYGKHSAKHY